MKPKSSERTLLLAAVALLWVIATHPNMHLYPPREVVIPPERVIDIGAYPNLQAEQRASIQRLSLELYRHPEASGVRIVAGPSAWRHGVMGFIRIAHLPQDNDEFWFDDRFSSPVFGMVNGKGQGISALRLFSEEEEIHNVARKNGTAADIEDENYRLGVQSGFYPPPRAVTKKPAHSHYEDK